MSIRNVALPWLSGGLILLGYVGFSWLRAKPAKREGSASEAPPRREALEPLAARLEQLPVEPGLEPNVESQQLPSNNTRPRTAGLGASFLGRASDALSPFHFGGKF